MENTMPQKDVAPLVVTIPLTSDQFTKLKSEVTSNPTLKFTIDPGLALRPELVHGTLDTPDVTLGFAYVSPTLTLTVLEIKSFLARHASDKILEEHIVDTIQKYS
jgi:hypothetical protein